MTTSFPIYKHSPHIQRERLTVKTFRTNEARHAFLNSQYNNDWRIHDTQTFGGLALPTKPGVYASAGGKWHNVKHLDPSILAHV